MSRISGAADLLLASAEIFNFRHHVTGSGALQADGVQCLHFLRALELLVRLRGSKRVFHTQAARPQLTDEPQRLGAQRLVFDQAGPPCRR